ncbi:MAG TPA: ATPase domain-containing protein [Longimicrobiales bacterium]|nr:ATPase domain-containing protein [Longimicrobiales bacterium]
MSDPADLGAPSGHEDPAPERSTSRARVPSGIGPLDHRAGGLEPGGSYLIVGTPGPAKLVAALQFVHAGAASDETALLLTNASAGAVLGIARAWGLELEPAWMDGRLRIMSFRNDFELRAQRSIEPEEVVEELDALAGRDLARVAVDPGSLFLSSGARSLLGSTYLEWAREHTATVCTTFSVDGPTTSLPSSADWLVHATTGRLVIEARSDDLYEITLEKAVPGPAESEQAISVQLKPGAGLVVPEGFPARRGRDRSGVDENRLLLVSLGGAHAADVEAWAKASFSCDVVSEPFEAVARAQRDSSWGGILIHAPRARVREAVSACQALRPLTKAAIVFASDDAVRSTDRIQILAAGADDCLSGGIDFRELDLRIRQAVAAETKPVPGSGGQEGGPAAHGAVAEAHGGRITAEGFREQVARRAADPVQRFFCVLDVRSNVIETERLEQLLTAQVRADEGDIVSAQPQRCTVLLQGAREAQLGPFLERLNERLRDAANGKGPETETHIAVLSHPADAERIHDLVGKAVAP